MLPSSSCGSLSSELLRRGFLPLFAGVFFVVDGVVVTAGLRPLLPGVPLGLALLFAAFLFLLLGSSYKNIKVLWSISDF